MEHILIPIPPHPHPGISNSLLPGGQTSKTNNHFSIIFFALSKSKNQNCQGGKQQINNIVCCVSIICIKQFCFLMFLL